MEKSANKIEELWKQIQFLEEEAQRYAIRFLNWFALGEKELFIIKCRSESSSLRNCTNGMLKRWMHELQKHVARARRQFSRFVKLQRRTRS